jgi:hypothetical protein
MQADIVLLLCIYILVFRSLTESLFSSVFLLFLLLKIQPNRNYTFSHYNLRQKNKLVFKNPLLSRQILIIIRT